MTKRTKDPKGDLCVFHNILYFSMLCHWLDGYGVLTGIHDAFVKSLAISTTICKGKWMLSDSPVDYPYSSAGFYESGKDKSGFLTHIGMRL